MSDPVTFTSTTARFALPNLFPGQAQKEFFVNESLARLDAVLHPAIEAEMPGPPASPVDGQAWLVANGAAGDWAGHEGKLAAWQSGGWIFVAPVDGMIIFDRSTGGSLAFTGTWQRLVAPSVPTGGTTTDSEARAAIASIIASLQGAGIFPAG